MDKKLMKIGYMSMYLLGFPILAIITLVDSIKWDGYGMYGAGAFASFIAVVVIGVVCAAIHFGIYMYEKKKGKKAGFKLRAMIIPIVMIFGVFLILEAAMPSVLADATSNTILYEDVVEDSEGMHQKLVSRVNAYKEKNGIKKDVKFQDAKVQKQFDEIFASMDKAYKTFNDVAISLALRYDMLEGISNGKIPLPVLATLIVKTCDIEFDEEGNVINANKFNQNATIEEIIELNKEEIAKALNVLLVNMDNISDPKVLNDVINEVLFVVDTADGIKWNIFQILGENVLVPDLDPNAEIIKVVQEQKLDETGAPMVDSEGNPVLEDKEVVLGSCLGYQDMAWLNGLDQMFFIPLLAMRNVFIAFAFVIALLGMLQQVIKMFYEKKYGEFSLNFKA